MGELDGIGDAVTGALIAGVVEPGTGKPGGAGSGACLNCGATLTGPYCAACGQHAQVHRSLRSFFTDFASGLFNFEGKLWRTIPMLAWRPGELTRRYIAGERARFISPVALYLFTVFLMFAVLGFTGAIGANGLSFNNNLGTAAKEETAALAKLQAGRDAAARAGSNVDKLDRRIAAQKESLAQLDKVRHGELVNTDGKDDEIPTWLRGPIQRVQRDPKAAVTNVQDATSKFSWLLIPLSVPFLWMLFPFSRRFGLYDHTVFVTYSLSFMMILVIAAGLLVAAGLTPIASFLFFVPPIHMYRQLKGAYGLRWYGALLRTVALVSFSFVAAVLFAIAMVAIGIF